MGTYTKLHFLSSLIHLLFSKFQKEGMQVSHPLQVCIRQISSCPGPTSPKTHWALSALSRESQVPAFPRSHKVRPAELNIRKVLVCWSMFFPEVETK